MWFKFTAVKRNENFMLIPFSLPSGLQEFEEKILRVDKQEG